MLNTEGKKGGESTAIVLLSVYLSPLALVLYLSADAMNEDEERYF